MDNLRKISAISLIIMLFLFALSACSPAESAEEDAALNESTSEEPADELNAEAENADTDTADEEGEISMKMTINDTEVKVSWENNESVKALAKMAENGPVTIETEPYGGFEQVGSIGQTLPSNDTNIKTKAGDIMLYTSSQMVIFYGSNSWAYTRLGRITDKSNSELRDLLSGYGCKVTITAE